MHIADEMFHVEVDGLGDRLLESGVLDHNDVTADSKGPPHVLSGIIGRGGKGAAPFNIRDRNLAITD